VGLLALPTTTRTIPVMADMRVWIDQDLCTGDGLCAEIAPDVFFMHDDGLAYVKESAKHYGSDKITGPDGEPVLKMAAGLARFPESLLGDVIEAADSCPGECIFIEPAE
jgi:ferredoxin